MRGLYLEILGPKCPKRILGSNVWMKVGAALPSVRMMPMVANEVLARFGNPSIMWVEENPTRRRNSMPTCVVTPTCVALSIPETSKKVV
jgi:hypothetical protein